MPTTPPSPPEIKVTSLNLTLLGEIGEVADQEIIELRDKFAAACQPAFEDMPRHKQATLVTLFRMDLDQLDVIARTDHNFVGLHNLQNELNFLINGIPELQERWTKRKKKRV